MPLYSFVKVDDQTVKEDFFFTMAECPKIDEIITDDDGVQWKRVFTLPYASVDSKIDPNNAQDFVEKTGKKKGTYGDLLDASRELSDKRAKENGGTDPVQKRFFEKYRKERYGRAHPEELKKKKIDKPDFSISFD